MRKRPNDVEKLDRISRSVDADEKGNVEVGKDLKVDGKIKSNSLVSSSNPDGSLLTEFNKRPVLHCYSIYPGQVETFYYNVYIPEDFEEFQVDKSIYIDITNAKYEPLRKGNYAQIPTAGYYITANGTLVICNYVSIETGNTRYTLHGCNIETKQSSTPMLVSNNVHVVKRY